jgi:hypothetical protein
MKANELVYDATLASIPDGVLAIGEDGTITYLNARAERLTGWTARDAAGRRFEDVVVLEDVTVSGTEPVRDAPTEQEVAPDPRLVNATLVARDGQRIEIEYSLAPLRADEGLSAGSVMVMRDIRDRIRIEKGLHRAEHQFRALIESAPDAMVIANDAGRIVLVNSQTEFLFGYSRYEILGEPVEMLLPESFRAEHAGHRDEYVHAPEPRRMAEGNELFARRKNGTEFPVEVSLSPLRTEGGMLISAAVRDISDRRRVEMQLSQAQRMEAIGRLAGGVAHDFNNLLTVISGNVELLDPQRLDDEDRARLTEIGAAASRAAALTAQLLAYSRQQVLAPRVVDLNDVVEPLETMLGRLIGEHIVLRTALAPRPACALVDPGQIEQVIMNLVVNARDAMPNGGQVAISVDATEVEMPLERFPTNVPVGSYALLCVSDTGVGIDPTLRRRVFDPYFTTKGVGEGTGLGLATVAGIVEQSGGYVTLESQPGVGTRVSVYLPLAAPASSSRGAAPGIPAPQRGTGTVLLVEDEEGVRFVISRMLRVNGFTVLDAPNGAEALRTASEHAGDIDLLVTDAVMPGMSGPDLATTLRSQRRDIGVLFISGYTDDQQLLSGVTDGEHPFIQKPFSSTELVGKVQTILSRRSVASGQSG